MIYLPDKDGRGRNYATWDKVTHSADDKDTAYQIAWLLSGIPDEEGLDSRPDSVRLTRQVALAEDGELTPRIPESQLAWMISLRAATLFNAIHAEHQHAP